MANHDTKGLQDKLKTFFRGLKTTTNGSRPRPQEITTLTLRLEEDLRPTSPLASRLKAMRDMSEIARDRRLEDFASEKLWTLLKDLLQPEVARETRHLAISFFTSLCESQKEFNGFLRADFFLSIENLNSPEDSGPQYEFLKALTDNGRDVSYFNEKIGPLILRQTTNLFHSLQPHLLAVAGGNHGQPKTGEFMLFLNNFIKFNQSFVDEEILQGIVNNICFIAFATQVRQDTLQCINVLETIISYAGLPPQSLTTFLIFLCRTVNVDFLCHASWKTVRNLLGTHLGHSALLTLCQFMETVDPSVDSVIIHGAVFFAGVSLWGSKLVPSLKYTPSTILSSFASALERKHIFISYEVLARVHDLVKSNGDTLPSITWDLVLEIIQTLVKDLQLSEWKNDSVNYPKFLKETNETLDVIESMVENREFGGAVDTFYNVIENSLCFRSEASIEKLLMYKHQHYLRPTMSNWLHCLTIFCERHFREEHRRALKLRAIDIIHQVCMAQVHIYEDELIEKIILHYFKGLDTETDLLVRQAGVQLIVAFLLESTSKKCHDMLLILERIISRVYENSSTLSSGDTVLSEIDVIDISTAVNGLIQIFQKKIYHLPSSIAISCYKILVRHLSQHYKKISVLDQCGTIGYNIFDCFFKIRANSMYHLGFLTTNASTKDVNNSTSSPKIRFSPYLTVDHRDGQSQSPDTPTVNHISIHQAETLGHQSPSSQCLFHNISVSNLMSSSNSSTSSLASTMTLTNFQYPSSGGGGQQQNLSPSINSSHFFNGSLSSSCSGSSPGVVRSPGSNHSTPLLPVVTSISLTLACKLVVTCLKKEKDWKILELVLQQFLHVLENKALILSKHGNDIDYLATALCAMMTDKSPLVIDSLRNAPPKFQRSEFQAFIFPILTSLVSYHSHLEPSVQLKIVKCLELGLVTKCSRICILALSICSLEMKDTMHKLLPEVLLSLSKITPKVNIAIPVLEFLSTLIHLPRIFASFVQDQYMAIFAIALPYTNPFKFNQYTVSLAHHVIAMWFLKCRLSFRRGFVSYIIKGLEANVWSPFEEESRKNAVELPNEDSSNRKRSSSLTEQKFMRRERSTFGQTGGPQQSQLNSNRFLDVKPGMTTGSVNGGRPDKAQTTFHEELTETCVDLMARYSFADCAALPTRFEQSNFLLSGGHSQAWLAENKIITITTSGCTQKELRDGLCDNCWLVCKKFMPVNDEEQVPKEKNITEDTNTTNLTPSIESHLQTEGQVQNSPESTSLQRRRHLSRSAVPGQGSSEKELHLDNKISSNFDEKSVFSPNYELSPKTKSDHSYCTCCCQGWAEIHIRRPTGNTSWMMRVQNQLSNHLTVEYPIKELSAMYINTLVTSSLNSTTNSPAQSNNSTNSSTQSSPSHQKHTPVDNQTTTTVVTNNDESPLSPQSPQSLGTPTEESPNGNGGNRRKPVFRFRRTNSSPEMCTSWKVPFLNQQREIEEQDEEESNIQSNGSMADSIPSVQQPSLGGGSVLVETTNAVTNGSISPFQAYGPIPEEIHHTSTVSMTKHETGTVEDLTPVRRDRMSTISVMSPARRNKVLRRMLSQESFLSKSNANQSSETGIRSGMSPGFIFLQLCAQGAFGTGTNKPLQIPLTEQNKKSLKVLDFIPPYDTHKIGVVYVGPGEASLESKILQNQYGSSRYREFLNGLGKLIKLSQVDSQKTFLGGLSRDGVDGEFATIWQDNVMQVIFHVATLMPNRANDPNGNAKKCHIGNDYVAIVYNNSGEEYDISTIKCQFLYACVVIEPLVHNTNRVIVKAKPILADLIGHTEPKIVSDQNLSILARQWALHSNLASLIYSINSKSGDYYATNWLQRLRHIKRFKTRVQQTQVSTGKSGDGPKSNSSFSVEDFTTYV